MSINEPENPGKAIPVTLITPQKNSFKTKDLEIFNFLFKKGAKISKHIDIL